MSDKRHLLSIGEISKLSFISVSALRFYDEKNIINPSYIDPKSGYRYYSFNQIYDLSFIKLATEIGLPLQVISNLFQNGKTKKFRELLDIGEALAQKKKEDIDITLSFIQQMKYELNEQQNYKKIPKPFLTKKEARYFFCEQLRENLSEFDFNKKLEKLMKHAQGAGYTPHTEWGRLDIYQEKNVRKYLFIEIFPSKIPHDSIIEIPEGEFQSSYEEVSRIRDLNKLYPHLFKSTKSVYVIETEMFLADHLNPKDSPIKLSISI